MREIAANLSDWLQHPEWKYSDSSVKTVLNLVYKMDQPIFTWVKTRPEYADYSEGIRVRVHTISIDRLSDFKHRRSVTPTSKVSCRITHGKLSRAPKLSMSGVDRACSPWHSLRSASDITYIMRSVLTRLLQVPEPSIHCPGFAGGR